MAAQGRRGGSWSLAGGRPGSGGGGAAHRQPGESDDLQGHQGAGVRVNCT